MMRKIFSIMAISLVGFSLAAQNKITVKGTVLDENDMPLPGLTVMVQNSTNGVVTDIDGKYSITTESNAVLLFDCMGYLQHKEPVQKRAVINVKMTLDNNLLEEVVVVGYGTMKRSDLTGSVSSISSKHLENFKTGDVTNALGGQIAGVSVTSADGTPGAGFNIVIRGVGTVNGESTPLYIVDGFEVDNIDYLANQDIASIEVLKDASASAIYGARAANGVVLVTTKSGKEGKLTVSYNGSATFRTLSQRLDILSPYEFVRLQKDYDTATTSRYYKEGVDEDGMPYKYQSLEDYRNVKGINWQDEAFRNTWSQNHDVSVQGGVKSFKYTASFSHYDENGIFVNSGYKKTSARVKFNYALTKWLDMNVNVNYTQQKRYGMGTSGGVLRNIIGYRPTGGLKTPDEVLINSSYDPDDENSYNDHYNPVSAAYTTDAVTKTRNWMANGALTAKITKHLTFKSSWSYNESMSRKDDFYYADSQSAKKAGGAYGQTRMTLTSNWSTSNVLTYDRKFKKKHKVTATLGHEYSARSEEYLSAQSKEFPIDALGNNQLSYGTPSLAETSLLTKNRLSFFIRGFYSYKDRYMITGTMRADASSVFATNNKWGFFPSFSAAWTISKEPWMSGAKSWLDNFKLRAGWGIVGNDRIRSFLSSDIYTDVKYGHGASSVTVLQPQHLANPNLRWEGASTTNVGLDLGFFDSRLNVNVDGFIKDTKDLLLAQNLAYVTGWGSQWQNVGKIRNKGIEVSLNAIVINKKNFSWSVDANISFIKNTLVSLNSGTDYMLTRSGFDSNNSNYDYIAMVGHAIGNMYGYVWDGIYQYSDFYMNIDGKMTLKEGVADLSGRLGDGDKIAPGYIKYKDLTGEGKITDQDRTIIGNGYPDWFGGFSTSFYIYGVDVSAVFQYSYGNDVFNVTRYQSTKSNKKSRNMLAEVADRWTPTNASNTVPSLKGYIEDDIYSRFIEDGSYLRLKNLTVGYTLPSRYAHKLKMSKIRAYVSASNLFCLTRYSGYDPEVNSNSSPLMPGIDANSYPKNTACVIGLELKF